ncbi:MAG: chlorophyll synthesis pathway protein BchC, partial [Alphaproteobacteria bacterium]|nr:chlorophyll synthesis pathway protein BchC [Alphaproteobacteria bacterium]
MQTEAIILSAPRQLSLGRVELTAPGPQDLVIRVDHSGVSTGTEKL